MALKDYFYFTREERRGVVALLVVIAVLFGVRIYLQWTVDSGQLTVNNSTTNSQLFTDVHQHVSTTDFTVPSANTVSITSSGFRAVAEATGVPFFRVME